MLQKVHFRLTSVAQKRCCLSSLITTAIKRIDQGCLSSVLFSQFTRPYRRLDEMAIRLLRWPHLRLRQRLDLCCIELRYKAVLGSESLSHFPAQLQRKNSPIVQFDTTLTQSLTSLTKLHLVLSQRYQRDSCLYTIKKDT